MRDYTHENNPFRKPLIYRNSAKLHFNWMRFIESTGLALFIAFLVFIGGRFGAFEKSVVEQNWIKDELSKVTSKLEAIKDDVTDVKIKMEVHISNSDDIKKKQEELYKKNKADRRKDLEEFHGK